MLCWFQRTWEGLDLPSAVLMFYIVTSCFCSADTNVRTVLVENEKVLKLIRSEILQTEIRVLYELLYILSNSYRGNKTYKGLQQVSSSGTEGQMSKMQTAEKCLRKQHYNEVLQRSHCNFNCFLF